MLSPTEKNLLSLRLLATGTDFDTGLLALLIQKSDEALSVSRRLFPLEMKAGRAIALESHSINALVEKGVVERTEGGLLILVESVVRVLGEVGRTAVDTTTKSSGSKKTSTTVFTFEVSGAHGGSLAFVQEIGARVRAGMVAQVAALEMDLAQLVIHEVGARVINGSIRGDAVTYTRGIVAKALRRQFVPAAGLALADELDRQLSEVDVSRGNGYLRVVK